MPSITYEDRMKEQEAKLSSRVKHLQWCKDRALEYANMDDKQNAIASMISDLGKWDGGAMYDAALLSTMMMDAMMFREKKEDIINWINGFN